jgi:hypothetical protein
MLVSIFPGNIQIAGLIPPGFYTASLFNIYARHTDYPSYTQISGVARILLYLFITFLLFLSIEVVCMSKLDRFPGRGVSLLAIVIGLAFSSSFASAKGSSGRLTLGDVTPGNGNISASSNPASGAFDRQFLDSDTDVAGYWDLGASIEYGDVDATLRSIRPVRCRSTTSATRTTRTTHRRSPT